MGTSVNHVTPPAPESAADGDSLAALRRDCAGMLPHWRVQATFTDAADAADAADAEAPVAPPSHGVSVPDRTARLLRGMSEYGD
ncbi:hypothetical protein ACSNOK_30375 [Streptomyces sp. URMC 126]|uniref:hypothetical protein n=1 Tax=Streptomyces sp. URMC 126 TaxID=3423401 RepID=UPI003F19FD70